MQEKAKSAKTTIEKDVLKAKDASTATGKKSHHNLVRNGLAIVALALIATSLFMEDGSDKPDEKEIQAIKASFKADGTAAREQIEQMQTEATPDQPKVAFEQGQSFESKGEPVNAYLMYFYAARQGNSEAAMKLAQMSDPLSKDNENAEPYQAYKWYKVAADKGVEKAQQQLIQLKQWAENSAQKGNPTAQRLLLQWQS